MNRGKQRVLARQQLVMWLPPGLHLGGIFHTRCGESRARSDLQRWRCRKRWIWV